MKILKHREFTDFQFKIMWRFCANALISIAVVIILYSRLWKQRAGDWIVGAIDGFMGIDHEQAILVYHRYFRGNKEIFFATATLLIFGILLWRLFRWMTRYFNEINKGIDDLLTEDIKHIHLSPEMSPLEHKLNAVKQTLEKQKQQTALAEQRKDELVMYLAHDIRTPLTSVIGYLNLLDEAPEMTLPERAKNVRITLDKAYRLEEMISEFFEITRYNSQQITLSHEVIDLYYMLVQLVDELSPVTLRHGNSVILKIDEDMTVFADPNKLARVFSNLIKNAVAYSYPDTDIIISAIETETQDVISFQNKGPTVATGQLSSLFDKFYRLDESRNSDTGGTGLGLAIAKEIIMLHGGSIEAASQDDTITFTIKLPKMDC